MDRDQLTPLFLQYYQLKDEHPGALMLMRVGDFFEAYGEDAETLARDAAITQTAKEAGGGMKLAMAGVPHFSVDSYLRALLEKGHRVAIADQMEAAQPGKGLVRREVTRVVTAGTVLDPQMLDATAHNYLVCMLTEGDEVGLAAADVTTGDFVCTELPNQEARLAEELFRFRPSEIVFAGEGTPNLGEMLNLARADGVAVCERRFTLSLRQSEAMLQKAFGKPVDLAGRRVATLAATALLEYLNETTRRDRQSLEAPRAYSLGDTMLLDTTTLRNLEVTETLMGRERRGSLLWALDQTITSMGARLLRHWLTRPLLDRAVIQERQNSVAALVTDHYRCQQVRIALNPVKDVERLLARVVYGSANARDLVALLRSLQVLPQLQRALPVDDAPPVTDASHLAAPPAVPAAPTTNNSGSTPPGTGTPLPAAVADSEEQAPLASTSSQELSAPPSSVPAPVSPMSAMRAAAATRLAAATRSAELAPVASDAENTRVAPAAALAQDHGPLVAPTPEPQWATRWNSLREQLQVDPQLTDLLARALAEEPPQTMREGGMIRDGFHAPLDELRQASSNAKNWIAALEERERELSGIRSLKVGYNQVFGYYLEVTRSHLKSVPDHYTRKQTLTNAERYITPELKEIEAKVLGAEEKIREIEYDLFMQLRQEVANHADSLRDAARAVAECDVFAALAETATRGRWTRPEMTDEDLLDIRGGRHPVVERALDGVFVPNDTSLDAERRLVVLTGPNMSGKSTYLRQTALIVLLAQIGSYVPADFARLGIHDRVFTRVGASDDLHLGQSTFMVEMSEAANILKAATRRSLVILDEIGRGTSTYDGLALARAIAEYLYQTCQSKTLFATHFHELTALARDFPGVLNQRVAVQENRDQVVFLHKIVPGGADRSYGIYVAQLAGLPAPVLERAQRLLTQLEKSPKAPVKKAQKEQLNLFFDPNQLVKELAALSIPTMPSDDAKTWLADWQSRL